MNENENQKKINNIQKEINFIDDLIKKTNERLKAFENSKDNNNKYLIYEDICELNGLNKDNNYHLIGIKNGNNNKLKFEFQNIEEPNKLYLEKKRYMNDEKLQYNKEYLNYCTYSNRLYIDSMDSKSPLDIFLIEPNNQIQEHIQDNDNSQIINLRNEQFDDKLIDIMKGNINNNIYFNDNNNFRKNSLNSELSFLDNNSNINI